VVYELPKAVKEHETEFHDNQIMSFTWSANGAPATRSRDEFTIIIEDFKDDSANSTIAMSQSLVMCNFINGFQ